MGCKKPLVPLCPTHTVLPVRMGTICTCCVGGDSEGCMLLGVVRPQLHEEGTLCSWAVDSSTCGPQKHATLLLHLLSLWEEAGTKAKESLGLKMVFLYCKSDLCWAVQKDLLKTCQEVLPRSKSILSTQKWLKSHLQTIILKALLKENHYANQDMPHIPGILPALALPPAVSGSFGKEREELGRAGFQSAAYFVQDFISRKQHVKKCLLEQ